MASRPCHLHLQRTTSCFLPSPSSEDCIVYPQLCMRACQAQPVLPSLTLCPDSRTPRSTLFVLHESKRVLFGMGGG